MIEFKHVSKAYPNGAVALNDVNINIEKGEFVFIVGSSGAGKSTFLKLIMCEEAPDKGEIIFNRRELSKISKKEVPYLRRTMGTVFQDFRLIDHMSAYENVAFAMHIIGARNRDIKKRVPYILSLVGLENKMKCKPSELSGGEQQRVGLARALVNNPKVIIADEPTGNVDPELSFEIVDLLSEINRRGTTVLMVTHEHELVQHFHKRVIEINAGVVVADTKEIERGTAKDIYTQNAEAYRSEEDEDGAVREYHSTAGVVGSETEIIIDENDVYAESDYEEDDDFSGEGDFVLAQDESGNLVLEQDEAMAHDFSFFEDKHFQSSVDEVVKNIEEGVAEE